MLAVLPLASVHLQYMYNRGQVHAFTFAVGAGCIFLMHDEVSDAVLVNVSKTNLKESLIIRTFKGDSYTGFEKSENLFNTIIQGVH